MESDMILPGLLPPHLRHHTTMTKSDVKLPPPPTRPRKIIQMKPRDGKNVGASIESVMPIANPRPTPHYRSNGRTSSSHGATASTGSKKTARKTAHSIIERRRRSKMNEEFDTLKEMIPACQGQAMHKLAVLQAGIDYVRYLEQCVTDLQAGSPHAEGSDALPASSALAAAAYRRGGTRTPRPGDEASTDDGAEPEDDDSDFEGDDIAANHDVVMEGLEAMPPNDAGHPTLAFAGGTVAPISRDPQPSSRPSSAYTSPTIHPQSQQSSHKPHSSYPSLSDPKFAPILPHPGPNWRAVSTHSSTTASEWSSPAFGAHAESPAERLHSPLTTDSSPALAPSRSQNQSQLKPASLGPAAMCEADQEATAALLMLNRDRRQSRTERVGLSVQDLLSG